MSMEKKGKPCDPGWNDPPMFSYEAQSAQLKTSKPRTLLNKRVAFPLQAPSQTPGTDVVDPTAPLPPCSLSGFPPPPSKPLTNPEDAVITSVMTEDTGNFDPDRALESVMNILSDEIERLENKDKHKDDILRRLNVMRDMWNNQKFSRDIQQKLLDLSKALESNEKARADELQKGLMVDHAQLCSHWMSGVRQILRLRKESLLSSDTTEDVTVMTPSTPTTAAADGKDVC